MGDYDFRGRVVMVSGGSRGIGRATARAFAESGASLAIASSDPANVRRATDELQALSEQVGGGGVLGVAADLSRAEEVQRFVEATLARFGGVDVLVNNVGAARVAPFLELTDDLLLSAWSLKLLCAIRLTRALVPVMERRGGGSVINIGGTSSLEPSSDNIAVATTNAGLRAFTKGVAADLARRGIRVNILTLGKVRTERLLQQAEREARSRGLTLQQVLERQVRDTPTGRVTEPEEVAEMVLFLASARARNLVGAEIVLDGGATRAL